MSGGGLRHALVSCEHASSHLPQPWRRLVRPPPAVLASHRGSDLGAWSVAQALAKELAAPLLGGRCSRLLVDLNRSLSHPQVFSTYSRELPADLREALIEQIYLPHRAQAEAALRLGLAANKRRAGHGQVVHWAVHSFTPRLHGRSRPYEIGLLFDPGRAAERQLMIALRRRLRAAHPQLRVVFNRPYRGSSDGFTRSLRARLGRRYLGIELELNQAWLARGNLCGEVVDAIAQLH